MSHADDSTIEDAQVLRELPGQSSTPLLPPPRPTWRWMLGHPARVIALGFGSGLSPTAPGTVGTLWAWASFLVLDQWLNQLDWAWVLAAGLVVGLWAGTHAARQLCRADPGVVVWDEVIAFWLVLLLVMPADVFTQALAFGLFRYFDAVKPGPVGWADRLCKPRAGEIGWLQGFGILFDDLVAAGCTLLALALGHTVLQQF